MNIIIFSRPIRSGKTTELLDWCERHPEATGVAMPDVNGTRMLMDIRSGTKMPIQCTDPAKTHKPLTTVGRYHFYTTAFQQGNEILMHALDHDHHRTIIIDEVGKLELEEKGFAPGLHQILEQMSSSEASFDLLLVVREDLYEAVVDHFNLSRHKKIASLALL